jgi:hypothetical protein
MCSSDFNAAKASQNTMHLTSSHLNLITIPSPSIISNTDMKRHVSARDGPRAIHKLIVAGMREL